MEVRVWRSFSCNNSSSYYLVATFDDASAAAASAEELREFLQAHAKDVDATIEANDYADALESSAPEIALGKKHGFEPQGHLRWGDEALHYWIPDVIALGNQLVLFHGYCGGFGKTTIPRYFDAVNATTSAESRDNPMVSIILTVPEGDGGATLARELGVYLDGMRETAETEVGWVFADSENPAPWGTEATEDMEFRCGVPFPAFSDTHQIGFVLEVTRPGAIAEMTAYFEKHGATDYRVAVDRSQDLDRFRAIAAAVCPECRSKDALRFLEAGAFDAPTDQMACATCGGMFDLETPAPAV